MFSAIYIGLCIVVVVIPFLLFLPFCLDSLEDYKEKKRIRLEKIDKRNYEEEQKRRDEELEYLRRKYWYEVKLGLCKEDDKNEKK